MKNLKKVIISILNDIDDEIIEYDGESLIDEGLLDSFAIITFIAMTEEKLKINIPSEEVTEDNFKTVNAIINLVEKYNRGE